MAQEIDDIKIKREQKDLRRKKRRGWIRSLLTRTLFLLGGLLILGIVVGAISEHSAIAVFTDHKKEIEEFTSKLYIACLGVVCLVVGFERKLDFDSIEITLEVQNITLAAQNTHFETSASTLKTLSGAIEGSSKDSKRLILKIDELISNIKPPTVLKDINWKSLIKQADEIDFLVQGWDGWMDHHSTELEDFFGRSGKFRLFVINDQGKDAGYVRKLMEKRLDKTETLVEAEIVNTISKIKDRFNEANDPTSKKVLEVFCLNEINWYFAAQFKSHDSGSRDVLVLSFYSHHKYLLKETTAIRLFRDSAPDVFTWFDAELTKLKTVSEKRI